MKILVPLVVCGFVLVGFFAVCLSVFLAPSESYILDNVVTTTTTENTTTSLTTTEAATNYVYAIIVTETTEAAPELSDPGEVIE